MVDAVRPVGSGADLARVLADAVLAGDAAGGDARGRQSSAVVVMAMDPGARWPFDHVVDLRVDDDPQAPQRLAELVHQKVTDA